MKPYPRQSELIELRMIRIRLSPSILNIPSMKSTDRRPIDYRRREGSFQRRRIFALLFREDSDLIETYIEHTKGYLKLYGN